MASSSCAGVAALDCDVMVHFPRLVYINENVGFAGGEAAWDEQIGLPPPLC